jgi:hypothetical protein
MSLFGYEIPHEHVECIADKIKVQMPYPPRRIGSILTPDSWRELSQHTHQMGIVRSAGPLAFTYKDGEGGLAKHKIEVGDWVMFKWGAGTSFNPSRGVVVSGGWRYLSSFNDVIGWCKPEYMPDPATMCWEDTGDFEVSQEQNSSPIITDNTILPEGVRERTVYGAQGNGT